MRKEFNIKYRPDIEAGRMKVETRDGSPARIVCWDCERDDEPIVALVKDKELRNSEIPYTYNKEGRFVLYEESKFDLFVVETLPISSFEDIFGNYIKAACNYAKAGTEEEIDIHSWAAGLLEVAEWVVVSARLSKSESAKPVWGWSEEDEIRLQQAITALESYSEWYLKEYRITRFKDIIDWLKSLCPHWKPSEKQMAFLGTAIEEFQFQKRDKVKEALESLYSDLKKL